MKLVSFAVVSFLAATVSAGFSAAFGNADYSAHRLERRNDLASNVQAQLAEGIKHGMRKYEADLKTHSNMKGREDDLEVDLMQIKFELQSSNFRSQKQKLQDQQDMAQALLNSQRDAVFRHYLKMMNNKEKLQENVGRVLMWQGNQKQIKDHNRQHPRDQWKVTAPTNYNKDIMFKQVSATCKGVDRFAKTKEEARTKVDKTYDSLLASKSKNAALQAQYMDDSKILMDARDRAWMETVMCTHMTDLYKRLFGARK
ncbi:hypothetical protein BASA61_001017 [Batrachochytrium salamandrivorans]|nr:hypothetical protein BASA61_001017 [Batrachochytrium salamandrivorans]